MFNNIKAWFRRKRRLKQRIEPPYLYDLDLSKPSNFWYSENGDGPWINVNDFVSEDNTGYRSFDHILYSKMNYIRWRNKEIQNEC